jgi:hypothetical protein
VVEPAGRPGTVVDVVVVVGAAVVGGGGTVVVTGSGTPK